MDLCVKDLGRTQWRKDAMEFLKNIIDAQNSRMMDWKLSRLWFTYFLCVMAACAKSFLIHFLKLFISAHPHDLRHESTKYFH